MKLKTLFIVFEELSFGEKIKIWHKIADTSFKSYGISGQIFGLISFFLSNRHLWVVLDGRSSQEYPVNARVPVKAPFLALTFPTIYTLMNFLMMLSVILLSILMILLSLYSKWDQAPDLWQQLELALELESALKDTVDLGREWLFDFNAGKTQLVSFHLSNNNGCYWCENGWVCSWGKIMF